MDREFDWSDDPEDVDWLPPPLISQNQLPENIHYWWIFYRWHGPIPPEQHRLSIAITRQITPPWRHGLGLVLRWKDEGHATGIWIRGSTPSIAAPREEDLHKVVEQARILDTLRDIR